ncbi:efflux RND transporter permease subunit [Thermodesulforhabdus norvegica]|uniref:Hydrophobe/amphiphile efflux-1 (HAE1) family protein/efflux transporter, outer membrane factor (OMF) lipoprotein, NodT family n=1 Tax=Thermodesulforhabdus norvegica TaxID=39841 RepID=A0A1I4SQL8_9BACT|nr:efflux RND transporter permease subunit [Thermodesulforhabdus norvegica]SFM66669.1 hydrophobe/amphiphile efflux-1 (HAE1) family protein/efflux transporter, outer membrane factor (OMF) lipoprotein, NodT family [Thermodesulforhabdus norvegica]
MLSRFFLDRPVFAWVIAIALMSAGLLAIHFLPVSQYPELAPPVIAVEAFYPGASAETVESTVTQIIEQKMTGLDRLWYISAYSSSSGASRIELTFAPGTDPDIAWSKVQNKLQLAMASLPEVVQRQGVEVSKSTRNYMLVVGIVSEDESLSENDLRDYAISNLEKVLARIPGVGEVEVFGTEHAMRIWLDPDRLTNYSLTVEDVVGALEAYNVEVSAGQFGGSPAISGQRLNASIVVQHYLQAPEEFENIPIRINQDGSTVRIGDVARAELGTERYDIFARYNGKPAAFMAIRKEPGANSLETADRIKKRLEELSRYFPPGVRVVYPYDTTPFTRVAIHEVVRTLIEAIILVFMVMWLFLGSFRATIIPTIAVPVVVLGTFAVIWILGFSINMLTMFAMILAIGLLVDDAIVVVENVDRLMVEEGLPPRQATAKSMDQITGALIGIGLVLSAVFGPMAFFPGSTGIIYRQFSVTIASAMLLSVVVALILTPVLSANILKPLPPGHRPSDTAPTVLRPFFRWFDRTFYRCRDLYVRTVRHIIRKSSPYVVLYLILVIITGFLFLRMPTSYLPDEDQGLLFTQVILPSGSTLEQTQKVMERIQSYFLNHEREAVESFAYVAGISFAGEAQNVGMGFVKLRDWELRDSDELRARAVVNRAMRAFAAFRDAMVFVYPPPAVIELGNASGFDFELLDFGGVGHDALMKARDQLLMMAAQDPRVIRVRPNGMDDAAQYKIDVDWEKAGALGIDISSIHTTLSAAFGGTYVNNFTRAGRVKKVYVQADAPFRMLPEHLKKLYVRNSKGEMVPFTSFASGRWTYGAVKLERYNGFPSINIWGEPAPGKSSGEAMKAMEELASKLPEGIGFDWTGLSFQEKMASAQAPIMYAFSIFVIFLVLAALYESWSVPISILLCLPLGAIGGILASSLRGMTNDVYFQIGILTTLGLTTKNAILIVQFAKDRVEKEGMDLVKATVEGARLRLRPIVMTSMAFGFGVLPLAVTKGPGSGAQNAIGVCVLGGMVASTFLATFFVPLFYVLVSRAGKWRRKAVMVMLITGLIITGGCSFIPVYERPDAPIPEKWPRGEVGEKAEEDTRAPLPQEIGWRHFINDPRMKEVIELALQNNRDLKLAALKVEKARALYGVQRAELFPALTGEAAMTKERQSSRLISPDEPRTVEQYSLNLGTASWEIDFFGRIRSLERQALEEYLSTEAARKSAQILLIEEVARAYLALAADREGLALAENTLKTQEEMYRLIRKRYVEGVATELDLRRAETQVESARRDVAEYTQRIAQDKNALDLLVGMPVPERLLPESLQTLVPPRDISPGLSSEVLLNRPDIIAAEHRLKAAYASIGAARAAFYPRISLTTLLGVASDDLLNLFDSGTGIWRFTPQLNIPIFDTRIWAAYRVSKVERDIAIAEYEKAIQNAFREVADALAVKATIDDQVRAQESLVRALERSYELSQKRYLNGIDSYLSVLDAQRSLYDAKEQLIMLKLTRLANHITLYAVLGGGVN